MCPKKPGRLMTAEKCGDRAGGDTDVALFMGTRSLDGPVTIDDVARAHAADLQTQDEYGVHYLRYGRRRRVPRAPGRVRRTWLGSGPVDIGDGVGADSRYARARQQDPGHVQRIGS